VRATYPFAAVVGQAALKRALILCAIEPLIGGVLIRGPRGVAKTTLARALAALVPGRFVELPLGATEERVVGSLSLESALADAAVRFAPGLLAEADRGVLYVDEVNLLPDHVIDVVLDAAATGVNHVERDGISHVHSARFVLVGTMNPDEGDLRPQLIDRFGLSVSAEAPADAAERTEIVGRRIAFDQDPEAFVARFAAEQAALIERCECARAALAGIEITHEARAAVAARCHEAGVDGVRADLAWLRAARAMAAWRGARRIETADIDAAADLALAHRVPGHRPPPASPSRHGSRGHAAPRGTPPGSGHGARSEETAGPRASGAPGISSSASSADRSHVDAGDRCVSASRSAERAPDAAGQLAGSAEDGACRGAMAPVAVPLELPHALPGWLARDRVRAHAARRRMRSIRATAHGGTEEQAERVDWYRTLARGRPRQRGDLVRRRRARTEGRPLVIAIDASASMQRGRALAWAKGVAHALARRAERAGRDVALTVFRDAAARLGTALACSEEERDVALYAVGSHGGTSLRSAVLHALELCDALAQPSARRGLQLVVATDGRTREVLCDLHSLLVARRCEVLFVDCERGPVRLGRCATLAAELGGRHVSAHDLWPPARTERSTRDISAASERRRSANGGRYDGP
jgi:magnesium chelatase subunit D